MENGIKRLREAGKLECFCYVSENLLADYVPRKDSGHSVHQGSKKCIGEAGISIAHCSSMTGFCKLAVTEGNTVAELGFLAVMGDDRARGCQGQVAALHTSKAAWTPL